MKLVIDASRANCIKKTGVEQYAFNVVSSILKNIDSNDQVVLYTQQHLNNDWPQSLLMQKNIISKVLNWPPRYLWTHLRLSFQLKIDKPDLFFIPAHVMPLSSSKNTIITLHDIAFKRYPESYSLKENLYQEFAVKFALKHAKLIIVPSEFTRKEILSFYPWADASKINVVYHGFSNNRFSQEYSIQEHAKVKEQYKLKQPYFLFIGRIEKKKNILGIIKAFETFKKSYKTNHQLVLIGKPGYKYNEIFKAIKNSNYKSDIIQPGWVEQSHLPILMQSATVFIYTTNYEGFGLPILEAFSAQTPVITSNTSACTEIAGDAALKVDSKDSKAISDALYKIISDKEFSELLVQKGLKRATEFSWQKCAKETYSLIRNILV